MSRFRSLGLIFIMIFIVTFSSLVISSSSKFLITNERKAYASFPQDIVVNLVDNGSFEIPDIGDPSYRVFYAGSYIGEWYVASGSVDIVNYWPAYEGKQSLDLEGYGQGTILQNISTFPGIRR